MRQNLLEISIFDYVFEAITAKIYLWTTAYTNSLVNVTFGSGKKIMSIKFCVNQARSNGNFIGPRRACGLGTGPHQVLAASFTLGW